MKKTTLIVICILLLAPFCSAIEPVSILTLDKQPILLGKNSEHLLLKKDVGFEEIRSGKYKDKFFPIQKHTPNYGYNLKTCWVHFAINNESINEKEVVLEINYTSLDFVDLYYFETNSPENVTTIKTGDRLPYSERPVKHRKFVIPLKVSSEIEVYLRIKTSGVLTTPLKLWKPCSFFENDRRGHTLYALYYGMIIVMIFYNLFIFFTTRDNSYLYYVLHITAIIFTQLGLNGFNSEIWPNFPNWNNTSLVFFLGVYFLTLLLFTKSYLKTKDYLPKTNKLLNFFSIALGFLTIFSLFVPYAFVIRIYGLLGLSLPIMVFIISFLIIFKYRPARYFITAMFILLVGTITLALMDFGVFPNNVVTNNAVQLGSALEIIILALGLASRINLLKNEIEEQNKELTRLSGLKDNFLSNTTHELKTPLHGIIGIADALKDGITGELNRQAKSNLSIIINSAKRLSLLVNDILDSQRLKKKDIVLDLKSFDINQIAVVVCGVSQPLIKDKPVVLQNHIAPGKFFVNADSNRLYQILQNLVSNACKFTDSGHIKISASRKDDMVSITVSDTGKGIPKEDHERIFKSFEQAKPMATGTGLGLSISKKLVELHGGSIYVESTPNIGSKFIFTIPSGSKIDQSEEIQISNVLSHNDDSEILFKKTKDQQGHEILVVDDDPVSLKVVSDYLILNRYKVHQCSSGKDAIDSIKENKPDLVLLDVMMPEIDGFSVCKKIREKHNQFDLPIIFLTAKNYVTDLVQGFSLGGNDYLTKPFSKNELLARVNGQIAISKAKNRLVSLREVANKTWKFKNTDMFTKEIFKIVAADPVVEVAAAFLNERLVKCTSSNKKECIAVFNEWILNRLVQDGFVFLNFKEIKNFVIFIKTQVGSSPIDIEYFKNLEAQAGIIVQNFRQLMSDTNFLNDIYKITSLKKHIRFIRTENKVTKLYEDLNDKNIVLNSSLNTIECFFPDDLIRANRSCLINPKKILNIKKEEKKGNKYFINVDGENISVSQIIIDTLAEEYQ